MLSVQTIDLSSLQPSFCNLESSLSMYASRRYQRLAASRSLIVEMDGTLASRRSFSSVSHQPELMTEVSHQDRHSVIYYSYLLQNHLGDNCGFMILSLVVELLRSILVDSTGKRLK